MVISNEQKGIFNAVCCQERIPSPSLQTARIFLLFFYLLFYWLGEVRQLFEVLQGEREASKAPVLNVLGCIILK